MFKIKNIKILLVSALLLVGVLAFVGHGAQYGCSTSSGFGSGCNATGNISMLVHHLLEIKSLTPAITNPNISTSLLLSVLAGLLITSVFLQKPPSPQPFFRQIGKKITESVFVWKMRFLRWFSFYYKRDPHYL